MVTDSIALSLSWQRINHRLLKYLFRLKNSRTYRGIISRNNLLAELEADPSFLDTASSRTAARVKEPSRSFYPGRSVFQNGVTPDPAIPASPGAASPRLVTSLMALQDEKTPNVNKFCSADFPLNSFSDDFIRQINISAFRDCREKQ